MAGAAGGAGARAGGIRVAHATPPRRPTGSQGRLLHSPIRSTAQLTQVFLPTLPKLNRPRPEQAKAAGGGGGAGGGVAGTRQTARSKIIRATQVCPFWEINRKTTPTSPAS